MLKIRIRAPTPSRFRCAAPSQAQVIRLPTVAIENTATMVEILAMVAEFPMNAPAAAAASIGVMKRSGLPNRKRLHE